MADTTLARLRDSDMWWSFRRSPTTVGAAVVTVLFFLGAIFAPWVAPYNPFDVKSLNLMDAFTPPLWNAAGSANHLLGTDNQGRDVLSAILYGTRVSLMIGLAAIVLSVTTDVLLGLLAGFRGGWVEGVIMRLADIQLTVPAILIALTLDGVARAALPKNVHDEIAIWVLVISIGFAYWPQFARVTRATTLAEAKDLYAAAKKAKIKHGVVQDKLWLPGLLKLKKLRDEGFFGKILSVRGEFGYWVFEGDRKPAQRPSWNYRKQDGGGIILDMLCHWRYVLDNLFGDVKSVSCLCATHIPQRIDESGKPYQVDVEDEVFATFEFEGGALAQVTTSWATRVKRDDLIQLQIDGTLGSAVAGGHKCFVQSLAATPKPAWNVDAPQAMDFDTQWQDVPDIEPFRNSYRAGWDQFLLHVAQDDPLRSTMLEGARDVQLTEACYQSYRERRWVGITPLLM